MPQDTRIALFLLAELAAVLQANDPDTFNRWLYGGIQDLGEAAVTELLLDWIDPFITEVEIRSVLGWRSTLRRRWYRRCYDIAGGLCFLHVKWKQGVI